MGLAWHTMGRPHLERYLGKLDLVHAPSLVFPPSRAPLVATVHDLCILKYPGAFPSRWKIFHHRGLRLILRHARVILADSRNTGDDLRSLIGRGDPRIRVVPLGVDVPEQARRARRWRRSWRNTAWLPDTYCSSARWSRARTSPAWCRPMQPSAPRRRRGAGSWYWWGHRGGWGAGNCRASSPRRACAGSATFPSGNWKRVYRGATIFVYPSVYEGFGLPVLEAMARGLAVVTSDSSSLREVGEGAALLVDPGDPMEMRKAMRRLIDDEDMRGELVERGRERAAAYRWENTIELTVQAYRDAQH